MREPSISVEDHASKQPPSVDGYRIIDLNCFMNSLMSATVCGTCKTHQMKITEEVVTSIASTFLLTCPCGAYGSFEIQKLHCVGHIQKRMGSGLRQLKKTFGKKRLADGKTIGGRGRLTDALIDKFQGYKWQPHSW